jgi:hypothetical protein
MDGSGKVVAAHVPKKTKKTSNMKRKLYDTMVNIGWKKRTLKTLLQDFDGLDYSIEDQIKNVITIDKDSIGIFEALVSIGMYKQKARKLASVVRGLEAEYSIEQLVDIVIEYAFRKYKPLLDIRSTEKYFYDRPQDTFYERDAYLMCNLSHTDKAATVVSSLITTKQTQEKNMWYHATSWRDARDILEDGVAHYKGRDCLDFGAGPSFYLTPKIESAIDWAQKKRKLHAKECAVLVFNLEVNNAPLSKEMFESPNKSWIEMVTKSRRCKKNRLDDCDMIYGPMVANVTAVVSGTEDAVPHRPALFQLALKGAQADRWATNGILGVLWISR